MIPDYLTVQSWKLVCESKEPSNKKEPNKAFIGTFEDMKKEIDTTNGRNFSYKIVDFELIKY